MEKGIKIMEWLLIEKCRKELGFALLYMQYYHPPWDEKQVARVDLLCKRLAMYESDGELTSIYWENFYKEIKDETENMC